MPDGSITIQNALPITKMFRTPLSNDREKTLLDQEVTPPWTLKNIKKPSEPQTKISNKINNLAPRTKKLNKNKDLHSVVEVNSELYTVVNNNIVTLRTHSEHSVVTANDPSLDQVTPIDLD